MKRLAVTLIMSAMAAQAAAETPAVEHPYIGLDYQLGTIAASSGPDADVSAARLRIGTELTRMFGLEAQAVVGMDGDKVTSPGLVSNVELNSLYGVFLRPQLPLGEVASVYGLLGYSYVDADRTSTGAGCTTPCNTGGFENGASLGVGVNVNVYKNIGVSADFIQYTEDYMAISVGARIALD